MCRPAEALVAPGPEVTRQTPHAAADAGVALRGVYGALFVPHEDVTDELRVEQRVVGGKDRTAGNPEHDLDANALQGFDQHLGSGEDLVLSHVCLLP